MCDTVGCDNEAEFLDVTHNEICEECVSREIEDYGASPEDFETI